MAEQVIGGRQCTVEGYVHDGEVVPYGTVDSIRYPQVLSFFYYLYPSHPAAQVQDKMWEITRTIMSHIGYDNAGFNIEYYWDEVQNKIWLLEINTRIAQSHCDLFEMVDGVSHQQVTVDLGLGRKPDMPQGEGPEKVAAEFFYRVFFPDAHGGPRPVARRDRGRGRSRSRAPASSLTSTRACMLSELARAGRLQLRRRLALDGRQQAVEAALELRAGDEEAQLRVRRHRRIAQPMDSARGSADKRAGPRQISIGRHSMKIDTDLPRRVREIEHLEIPMPDGTRLAARIWMPEDAETRPVPAILEYIPYRKNDKTLERDHARAPWLAGARLRLCPRRLRGTGESEGVMEDEYTEVELQDGCDVIAWIADQDWCDGGVGIVGISWGGFNGLQLAALRPPALKAVVTICSTDDRYADDIHYMGGTLLGDQLSWASVMFGINTLPPDPAHVGERWREMWEARLDGSGLWLEKWMQHQTRDDFWKHGSICEN